MGLRLGVCGRCGAQFKSEERTEAGFLRARSRAWVMTRWAVASNR